MTWITFYIEMFYINTTFKYLKIKFIFYDELTRNDLIILKNNKFESDVKNDNNRNSK